MSAKEQWDVIQLNALQSEAPAKLRSHLHHILAVCPRSLDFPV